MAEAIFIFAQALLHSLWQIALLAAGLWTALKLIPQHNGALRYKVSVTVYGAVPVLLLMTCWILARQSLPIANASAFISASSFALQLLVALWAIGAALSVFRVMRNGHEVWYISRQDLTRLPVETEVKFQNIARKLGLKSQVKFAFSPHVAGPCAIAYFRPLILLPLACLTQLNTDELEAIIAHELAHIRRYDGLFCALQSICDAIFYYHPAAKWISRQVRQEREWACDDLAAGAIPDRASLATGLLKLGLGHAHNAFILSGSSDHVQSLHLRVQRIVTLPQNSRTRASSRLFPRSLFALCFSAFACASVVAMALSPKDISSTAFSRPALIALKDDVCAEVNAYNLYAPSQFYRGAYARFRVTDGKVYMNDIPLPAERQSAFLSVFSDHKLDKYREVRLRYWGDDVKLMVRLEGEENETAIVYRLEPEQRRVRTFRLPANNNAIS